MKKFRFQLDTLLKVTRMKKDEAEVKFAEVSRLLEQQRQQLAVLLEEMQQGQRDYENLTQAKHLTVGTLMTYNSFFGWKLQWRVSERWLFSKSFSTKWHGNGVCRCEYVR